MVAAYANTYWDTAFVIQNTRKYKSECDSNTRNVRSQRKDTLVQIFLTGNDQPDNLNLIHGYCLLLWKYQDTFQLFSYTCQKEPKTQSYTASRSSLSSLSATVWKCWIKSQNKVWTLLALTGQEGANYVWAIILKTGDFMMEISHFLFIIKKYYFAFWFSNLLQGNLLG